MLDFDSWTQEQFENYYGKETCKRLYQCLRKFYEEKDNNFFNDDEFEV